MPGESRSVAARVLAAMLVAAGATLAAAPFLTAQGPSGPAWPFPGSILDLKPVYGVLAARRSRSST